ncbi:peptidase MA family metallohydrolase [Geotalea toluenoxydans]|uniref:peptidase MA family metallohydrolase n=1 Tax=Geotalea toluenoxydans TaxID=421624 RepID=UPI0006CF44D9|nr:peptidase MA family metallohydrolase [Geotalea toluenoxydans]
MQKMTFACLSVVYLLAFLFWPIPSWADDPLIRNDYALELLNKGEYEKALEQLQRAFSFYPYDETLRKNLAVAYMYMGKKELENNRYLEAAENFDHARELSPGNSTYGMMRGIAFYLAKNYDASKFELRRAIDDGNRTTDIYYFLGRAHYDSGELESAVETLVKAQELEPGNKVVAELLEKIRREVAVESKMGKGHSSKFEISYDTEATSSLADAVLDALETAYNQVGSDLDYFPSARIPVILYTKKDYRLVTSSPEWSGGLYDGKIRLPIGGAAELTPQLRAILFHEYTHVVVNELARGNVPTWLNEGLAEYEGRREYNPPMAELGGAAKIGSYLPFSSLEGSFGGLSSKQASLAYQQSYSLVNYMIGAYGWFNVKEILVNLGRRIPVDAALSKALGGFAMDYAGMVREWQNYMRKEFGR